MQFGEKKSYIPELIILWIVNYTLAYLPYILETFKLLDLIIGILIILFAYIVIIIMLIRYCSKLYNISKLKLLGLESKDFSKSLRLSLIFVAPIPILRLYLFLVHNIPNTNDVPSWFFIAPRPIIPLIAMLRWIIGGIITFSIIAGFSIELLDRNEVLTKRTAFLVFLILCGFYNAPLTYFLYGKLITVSLVGEIIDIVMLGIGLMIYIKTRNALGIIIAYALIYEGPVNIAILFGWGAIGYILWQIFWLLVVLANLLSVLKNFNINF